MGLFNLFRRRRELRFEDVEMKSEHDIRLHIQNLDLGLLQLHCEHNRGTRIHRITTHSHELTAQFKDNYLIIGDIKAIDKKRFRNY